MKLTLFRVDGSHHLGMGHIMRCLAFAEGLDKIRMRSLFLIRDYEPNTVKLIRQQGFDVETIPHDSTLVQDAFQTSKAATLHNVNFIVTDLSHADNLVVPGEYGRYFNELSSTQKFMIAIDDLNRIDFPFDIQVIPYYGADSMGYESHSSTKLLLGPAYFIFRQDFIEAAKVRRVIQRDAGNILLTMGGADPQNLTVEVIKALSKLNVDYVNLRVVMGPGFDVLAKKEIRSSLNGFQGDCELVAGDGVMAELMLWADLAVVTGGLTKYELAVTGTPSITIASYELETAINKEFGKSGSTLYLGLKSEIDEQSIVEAVEQLLIDHNLRVEMSRQGKDLVDGRGIERIISEIPRSVLM